MSLFRLAVLACLLAFMPLGPAQAARVGESCQPWVIRAMGSFVESEEKVEAAQAGGRGDLCSLLADHATILDAVARTIAACPEGDENWKLLPEIEALLGETAASRVAHKCPRPIVTEPQ